MKPIQSLKKLLIIPIPKTKLDRSTITVDSKDTSDHQG